MQACDKSGRAIFDSLREHRLIECVGTGGKRGSLKVRGEERLARKAKIDNRRLDEGWRVASSLKLVG